MTFIDGPIQYLLTHCTQPVVDLDLFSTGTTVPVISGAEVNKFVYSNSELWDYSKGREAFRTLIGPKYITLLYGLEYYEKQRSLQQDLRTDFDEENIRQLIRSFLDPVYNQMRGLLSDWARDLSIYLLWATLYPCTPVPISLLDEFEELFQYWAAYGVKDSPMLRELKDTLKMHLRARSEEEFSDRITPFIAGIRALSTAIEWLVLARWSKWGDLKSTLCYQPPFILFPLYPADWFHLWVKGGRMFKRGQLIFHAMCVEQWRDPNAPLALFGGGQHKCPGRHLVMRLLELVQGEITEVEDDFNLVGGHPERALRSKFNGLLVPFYDWRFE